MTEARDELRMHEELIAESRRKSAERRRNGASAKKPKRSLGQNKNAASKLSSASGNMRVRRRQRRRQRRPNVAPRRSARLSATEYSASPSTRRRSQRRCPSRISLGQRCALRLPLGRKTLTEPPSRHSFAQCADTCARRTTASLSRSRTGGSIPIDEAHGIYSPRSGGMMHAG